jgi:hypothetical protein
MKLKGKGKGIQINYLINITNIIRVEKEKTKEIPVGAGTELGGGGWWGFEECNMQQ